MRLFLIAAVLILSSCATVPKLDAAGDVHALLIAIRDNDRPAFDALVDRRGLKQEIQNRLTAEASRIDPRVAALASLLGPGVASLAGDALIRPEVFRAVADYYGYRSDTKIPGRVAISTALRRLPDGRVCAVKDKTGPCLMTFTRAIDGRWKLSGFDGELSMLRL
jgi:hypothetical protein